MELMENDDNMQEQMGNINGETEFVRAKISSNKKHCNKNKECLWWAHEYIPMKKVRMIKNTHSETSKTQMQRFKRNENDAAEYLWDVGHGAMHIMALPEENREAEIFEGMVAQWFQN